MTAMSETEIERMRRVPGIVFADEGSGRVPKIAGTGLDVVQVYLAGERSEAKLRRAFPWLSTGQVRAALRYFEAYRDEIERDIAENYACIDED